MAIGKRLIGGLEKSMFVPGGKYFQRKERIVKGMEEKKQARTEMEKKDWKIVEKSLALYKNAMEQAKNEKLSLVERAKILKNAEDFILGMGEKTYKEHSGKQSLAHKKLGDMSATLGVERMRLMKK